MCDEDRDLVFINVTPTKKRRTIPHLESEDDPDSQHLDCDFSTNLAGAAPSSSVPIVPDNDNDAVAEHQHGNGDDDADADFDDMAVSGDEDDVAITGSSKMPRRSTRLRQPPKRLTMPGPFDRNTFSDEDKDGANRLEQIDCVSPRDCGLPEGHPACRLRIIMHPIAMALISLHSHLTRTEVIGYLGGDIRRSAGGDVDVLVAEAFPAQGIGDRALAKSGRSAFAEVEIDPESSVEVMTRMTGKNLQVVGWYHSHPDASFSVEPSRVDIENQHNYQHFIFKDAPFVAGIVAPYNEDLPDHMPDIRFFHVHEGVTPLKLPFSVGNLGSDALQGYMYGDHRYPIDDFITESLSLIATYSQFPKRVRLDRDWREGIDGLLKLKHALFDIVHDAPADDAASSAATTNNANDNANSDSSNKKLYLDSVQLIMGHVERQWKESGQIDDERRDRNKEAAARRKKRNRRR